MAQSNGLLRQRRNTGARKAAAGRKKQKPAKFPSIHPVSSILGSGATPRLAGTASDVECAAGALFGKLPLKDQPVIDDLDPPEPLKITHSQ